MYAKNVLLGCAVTACVLLTATTSVHATDVFVLKEVDYEGPIGAFYNGSFGGPGGTSATYISGDLSTYSFSGVKLLWALPADDFTPDEISTMASFLSEGGHIGFLGEYYGFATARDNAINAAVDGLGGHIEIATNYADNGYPHYANRSNDHILADAFTEGVNSFVYGLFSPLILSDSATALILGEDKSSILLAYENIGAGTIFVMADQNTWDLDAYSAGTDNRTLFTNILTVPEPASALLLGLGLLGLPKFRKK